MLTLKKISVPVILGIVLTGCLANQNNRTANTGYNSPAPTPNPAYNQQNAAPVNITDLYNTNAGYAKQQLQARGFNQTAPATMSGGYANTLWFNPATNQCFNLEESNNMVMTLNPANGCQGGMPANTGYNNPPPNNGYNAPYGAPAPVQPILGQVPPALANMVGAKGGQAEGYLMNNGYVALKSQGLTTFWQEQATGGCVAIQTSNGFYQSIVYVDPNYCR